MKTRHMRSVDISICPMLVFQIGYTSKISAQQKF